MYNHANQYRCPIIRGKSQKEIDDLLPAYAKIIFDICPCTKDEFATKFNNQLEQYLPEETKKKTLDNHRTEIVGKLFGMYYLISRDGNELIYPSERTLKFLNDNDQPAFFKDVCYKMQFPNGMSKINNTLEIIKQDISLRQYCYLSKVLLLAESSNIHLTKSEIGYYILNNLDALQRNATPSEIITQIIKDRKDNRNRQVKTTGNASSFDMQHINEQINYFELANLIIIENNEIHINLNELNTINLFSDKWDSDPLFDVSSYNLTSTDDKKKFQRDWDLYNSRLSDIADKFETSPASLGIASSVKTSGKLSGINKLELGDEGEEFVFRYEKQRVANFNSRLVNKVIALGKTKGIGYDIQSVVAEPGEEAEFVRYIEVKSTRRVTAPDINDKLWVDTLNITRNEWIAAQQHNNYYFIYRVYFVRGEIILYILKNIWEKEKNGEITVSPMTYRVDFGSKSIDKVIYI